MVRFDWRGCHGRFDHGEARQAVPGTQGDDQSLFGDADQLGARQRGGDQIVKGLAGDDRGIAGDARDMSGEARGGDDTVLGGPGDDARPPAGASGPIGLAGGALNMRDASRGGNDLVSGGEGDDWVFGDADGISGNACGDDDRLFGGPGNDVLWGDAFTLEGNVRGGNDLVGGGPGDDAIWGDGNMAPQAIPGGNASRGGDDVLIGGAGGDTFVFVGPCGEDVIVDLGRGADKLDFGAYLPDADGNLVLVRLGLADLHVTQGRHGTTVTVDMGSTHGTVVLTGVTGSLDASLD